MLSTNNVNNYGWKSAIPPGSCEYIVPFILEYIKDNNFYSVLDIGCGNGAICNEIKKRFNNIDVVGIDADSSGINIAKKLYNNIEFHKYSVDKAQCEKLKSRKFDFVISTEVIEHLYSPQQLLTFCSKYLSPNGKLLITCPYFGYLKNIAISILGEWDSVHTSLWEGGHIKFWSKKTITKLLNDNGFKIIRFTGAGRIKYLWKSMVVISEIID